MNWNIETSICTASWRQPPWLPSSSTRTLCCSDKHRTITHYHYKCLCYKSCDGSWKFWQPTVHVHLWYCTAENFCSSPVFVLEYIFAVYIFVFPCELIAIYMERVWLSTFENITVRIFVPYIVVVKKSEILHYVKISPYMVVFSIIWWLECKLHGWI